MTAPMPSHGLKTTTSGLSAFAVRIARARFSSPINKFCQQAHSQILSTSPPTSHVNHPINSCVNQLVNRFCQPSYQSIVSTSLYTLRVISVAFLLLHNRFVIFAARQHVWLRRWQLLSMARGLLETQLRGGGFMAPRRRHRRRLARRRSPAR